MFLLVSACQKESILKPGSVETNIVNAVYISPAEFDHMVRLPAFAVDGEAKQAEWGGPLDQSRPFTLVRCSAANGSGSPGDPVYVSLKAMYTDTDLFLLVQWADPTADEMKDAIIYRGPDLTGEHGCQAALTAERSWLQSGFEEDRFYLAFEAAAAGDEQGSFDEQGCLVACHQGQSPHFGRLGYGRLDVWAWLATRTNRVRDVYVKGDNATFPRFGIPAYLVDMNADPIRGLGPDAGFVPWHRNWAEGKDRPLYIYRPTDDRFNSPSDPHNCFNKFGEACRVNNGLPLYYIWREDTRLIQEFGACDTIDNAVLPAGQDASKWRPLNPFVRGQHIVSGYYYSYPSGSVADVHGKAVFRDGIWTLEIGRPLVTSDAINDVQFSPRGGQVPGDIVFTVAVADASPTEHWGSGPQILHFLPKATTLAKTAAQGGRP